MADRDNQVITYLNDKEHSQLKEWSNETGKSMSHLLREAILEYTDRDRAARLEGQIEDIDEKVEQVLASIESDTAHTHKTNGPPTQGSEAVEKARSIVSRLQANHDEVMKDEAVQRAIEDIAGIDDRTVRKYKRLFRKRGILFEHPGEPPIWTTESEQWFKWLHSYAELNGIDEAENVVENYPALITSKPGGGIDVEMDRQGAKI